MQPQSFDASGGSYEEKNVDTQLISGVYLNYDVILSPNDDINYLAGVEELNYFNENGVYRLQCTS
ncbi:hypothetical protein ASQ44_04350 [Rickettsia rhipicephali]|nr:hypothetical protein ASQ44_04350 [Rickettsia rhipicephali]